MTPGPEIEPGTHWWEASALMYAIPAVLLPIDQGRVVRKPVNVKPGLNVK